MRLRKIEAVALFVGPPERLSVRADIGNIGIAVIPKSPILAARGDCPKADT